MPICYIHLHPHTHPLSPIILTQAAQTDILTLILTDWVRPAGWPIGPHQHAIRENAGGETGGVMRMRVDWVNKSMLFGCWSCVFFCLFCLDVLINVCLVFLLFFVFVFILVFELVSLFSMLFLPFILPLLCHFCLPFFVIFFCFLLSLSSLHLLLTVFFFIYLSVCLLVNSTSLFSLSVQHFTLSTPHPSQSLFI